MERGVVVRGRLHGKRIELDAPIGQLDGDVEVIVRAIEPAGVPAETIFDFLRHLPVGTRAKEDIDRQIAEERESWGER